MAEGDAEPLAKKKRGPNKKIPEELKELHAVQLRLLVDQILRDKAARFKIQEKFLPVAGTESSRNRNFDQNFDFVLVISGVFKVINVK
jgi:hypothetical protein